MSKQTTLKPISLGYREVGGTGAYTSLMGVLKGLAIAQDEPDSTEIEAEFYDAPFDIIYQGKPVTMTFELANYELTELPALFGGSVSDGIYEGAPAAFTSEHEWKLDFQRGFGSLVIYKGLTIGTIKKDADGALNYNVTITALVYTDTSVTPNVDHMYKIVGTAGTEYTLTAAVDSATKGSAFILGTPRSGYQSGASVQLVAAAKDGYKFVNWTNGATAVSTDNPVTFTMPAANTTLTANFTAEG